MNDIAWVITNKEGISSFFFCVDGAASRGKSGVTFGKLIYTTAKPFGDRSISYETREYGNLYRLVCKQADGKLVLNDEYIIQEVAEKLGYAAGSGLYKNINYLNFDDVIATLASVRFLDRFPFKEAHLIADKVGRWYGIDSDLIRLSGGGQINGRPLEEQHDLDVVIPVKNHDHAENIWKEIRDKKHDHLVENGYKSPMRWICNQEHMICPFFVYAEHMTPPILDVKSLSSYSGELEVIDARYSIFNMPILETVGDVDFVAFRSRVARSCIEEGEKLNVNGELVEVLDGDWCGRVGVIVSRPFFEITNLSCVMDRWNA